MEILLPFQTLEMRLSLIPVKGFQGILDFKKSAGMKQHFRISPKDTSGNLPSQEIAFPSEWLRLIREFVFFEPLYHMKGESIHAKPLCPRYRVNVEPAYAVLPNSPIGQGRIWLK